MLAFVTSLRHPDNARDYAQNELLLQGTLHSIAQQTSDAYIVIVVSNVPLSFPLPDRVVSITVNFPSPTPPGAHPSYADVVWDKGTKLGIGLIAARDYTPDYVMVVDADDFVHRDLVAFTVRHAGSSGWYISKGWRYSGVRNVFRSLRAFHLQCGSAYIMPLEAYAIPPEASIAIGQGEVLDVFGDRLATILGSHMKVVPWGKKNGYPLMPLPFRGAVHHVDTGENHSGGTLSGVARGLSDEMRAIYGIPSSTRPELSPTAKTKLRLMLSTPNALIKGAYKYLDRTMYALTADDTPRFDMYSYRDQLKR